MWFIRATKKTKVPRTSFLSLPTEIRLQIAAYALEQHLEAGFDRKAIKIDSSTSKCGQTSYRIRRLPGYKASSNLQIRLVCRQFRNDFTALAWEKTTFYWTWNLDSLPEDMYRHVRKLVVPLSIRARWWDFASEEFLPPAITKLTLDHLIFVTDRTYDFREFGWLVPKMKNVRKISCLLYSWKLPVLFDMFKQTIQEVWEECHRGRYGSADSSNGEHTWWEGEYVQDKLYFSFMVQPPMPAMDAAEHGKLIQLKLEELEPVVLDDSQRKFGVLKAFKQIF